jgi:hypothetical protein
VKPSSNVDIFEDSPKHKVNSDDRHEWYGRSMSSKQDAECLNFEEYYSEIDFGDYGNREQHTILDDISVQVSTILTKQSVESKSLLELKNNFVAKESDCTESVDVFIQNVQVDSRKMNLAEAITQDESLGSSVVCEDHYKEKCQTLILDNKSSNSFNSESIAYTAESSATDGANERKDKSSIAPSEADSTSVTEHLPSLQELFSNITAPSISFRSPEEYSIPSVYIIKVNLFSFHSLRYQICH